MIRLSAYRGFALRGVSYPNVSIESANPCDLVLFGDLECQGWVKGLFFVGYSVFVLIFCRLCDGTDTLFAKIRSLPWLPER